MELLINDVWTDEEFHIKIRPINGLKVDKRSNVWKAKELYQATLRGEINQPSNFDEITPENIEFYYLHFVGDNAKKHTAFLFQFFSEEEVIESYTHNNHTNYLVIVIPNYYFETLKILAVLFDLNLLKVTAKEKDDEPFIYDLLKDQASRTPKLNEYIENNHKWLMFKRSILSFFREITVPKDIFQLKNRTDKNDEKNEKEKINNFLNNKE